MNSKRRCTLCKDYYEADSADAINVGLSGVCSPQCLSDLKDKARAKRARRTEHRQNRIRYGRRLNPNMREVVRTRDQHRCRFCGVTSVARLEIHHIEYRSQGGADEAYNLILLCDADHRLMHTSKKKWQPLLKGVQMLWYFEGVMMSVAQAETDLAWLNQPALVVPGPDAEE